MPETYLDDADYYFLTEHLTHVLLLEHDDADARYHAVQAALRSGGLELGDIRLLGDRLIPARYDALCEALAVLDADPGVGVIDECRVKITLGLTGNVWPAWVEQDVLAEAA